MSEEVPVPTTQRIFNACPRFRLLIVGASGVGKSSLLNAAFGLELPVHSDREGVCDINAEIISPRNERFVVHDSQGYARGERANYQTVSNFIEERGKQEELADRLHAIWLCIETPHANTLLLEKGAEGLIRDHGKVPLIVAFMQYDMLVAKAAFDLESDPSSRDLSDDVFDSEAYRNAELLVEEHCVKRLKTFSDENNIPCPPHAKVSSFPGYEDVTEILAVAQKADAETKVNASIAVGKKEYWRGLASVMGPSLKARLRVIHIDIVNVWFGDNMDDNSQKLLYNIGDLIITLVDLTTESDATRRKGRNALLASLAVAGPLAGVTAAASGPAAPVAAPVVFGGLLIAGWIGQVDANTPMTISRMMGYIVHLLNVLRRIFRERESGGINGDVIESIARNYETSEVKRGIDREIREFAKGMHLWNAGRDHVLNRLVTLVKESAFEGNPGEA